MAIQDQAVWANVNVPHPDKGSVSFKRGELLPEPASDEESAARAILRLGGALRAVEVVYTPEELATRARDRATLAAAATAAHDPEADAAEHPPTLTSTHGSPVVIGPPDGKDDDDAGGKHAVTEPGAAAALLSGAPGAHGAGTPGVARPHANATKAAWVDYAVTQDMDRDDAEAMTRDQLARKYES